MIVSTDSVRELLDYNAEAGEFYWKSRDVKWFNSIRSCSAWNRRYANNKAGCVYAHRGQEYIQICILGKKYLAHRLAWAYHYNEWPNEIDHINHLGGDNRIINLRSVNHTGNARNRRLGVNNKTGVNGVAFRKDKGKWYASIGNKNKPIHLGYFSSKDDAEKVRKLAEQIYGYHENHGIRNVS
jgi:hypothetical protein